MIGVKPLSNDKPRYFMRGDNYSHSNNRIKIGNHGDPMCSFSYRWSPTRSHRKDYLPFFNALLPALLLARLLKKGACVHSKQNLMAFESMIPTGLAYCNEFFVLPVTADVNYKMNCLGLTSGENDWFSSFFV